MIKAGLVVEGGGMRGVYSSGVLDFFIEKDLFFDDKITTGKVKIPIGIVFIVSKDMKQLQNY